MPLDSHNRIRYYQSTSNKLVSPNYLYLYFPTISEGIYKFIAIIQNNPATGYTPYSAYFEVIGNISYPAGGEVAKLAATVGFDLKGKTTVIGSGPGYTTVNFEEEIPLSESSGVTGNVLLPTFSSFSGKEVGYLIRVR